MFVMAVVLHTHVVLRHAVCLQHVSLYHGSCVHQSMFELCEVNAMMLLQ